MRSPAVVAFSAGRVVAGATLLVAPRLAVSLWAGKEVPSPVAVVLARALGIRDVLLGLATMRAVQNEGDLRPWLLANAAADGVDALATLAAWGRLDPTGRLLVLGAATSATAFAAVQAARTPADGV